jgi:hypothetical protein
MTININNSLNLGPDQSYLNDQLIISSQDLTTREKRYDIVAPGSAHGCIVFIERRGGS